MSAFGAPDDRAMAFSKQAERDRKLPGRGHWLQILAIALAVSLSGPACLAFEWHAADSACSLVASVLLDVSTGGSIDLTEVAEPTVLASNLTMSGNTATDQSGAANDTNNACGFTLP